MGKKKSGKVAFICFLSASICYYIVGIIEIVSKEDHWVIFMCLGSAFLCLSTTYLNKNKEEK